MIGLLVIDKVVCADVDELGNNIAMEISPILVDAIVGTVLGFVEGALNCFMMM